jgi:hypothetical protein
MKIGIRNVKEWIINPTNKQWSQSISKWESSWLIFGIIKVSKYEIVRGYPETKYIVDKTYGVSLHKRG